MPARFTRPADLKAAVVDGLRASELQMSGGAPYEIRAVWDEWGATTGQMNEAFPLTQARAVDLRRELQSQVREIYRQQVAAQGD